MEWCPPEVAVVVDGEFGDRVAPVSAAGAVWIAGSATNRAAVERLRRGPTPYVISVFNYEPGLSGAEAFADILSVVHEHHGFGSCNPPYRRLVVYGARLNATTTEALEAVQFEPEGATTDGFTAVARGAA
jgi:hypothetical protein